jgi:hypothetical protein
MSSESHTSGVGTTTPAPDQYHLGSAFPMGETESPFGSTTTPPPGPTSDLTDASEVSIEDQNQSTQAQHQFQNRN